MYVAAKKVARLDMGLDGTMCADVHDVKQPIHIPVADIVAIASAVQFERDH